MPEGENEGMVQKKPTEEHVEYVKFRRQLDKLINSMCPKYSGMRDRVEQQKEDHKMERKQTKGAKKSTWPKLNVETKRELTTYVETATFDEIMRSKEHKKKTNEMTFETTSNKLCYWCLTEECLHARTFHSSPKNKGLHIKELDKRTNGQMNICTVYNRKRLEAYTSARIKETERET